MKRIYLDQNKWIDVAAARKGLAKGEPFHDALLLLEAGTEAGHVSLPLSSAHYMETQARRHWESRRDLAATMVALSSLQTIAPLDGILPAEVDRALLQRYGQPAFPRPLLPFGSGASHAFARDIPRYRIPGNLAGLVANAWEFERSANKLQEAILLAGLPPDLESRIPDFEPLAHLKVGENYAAGKEELRARRVAENWNKGERADRIAKAQAFSDHLEVLDEAFRRAGLQLDRLLDEGQSGMNDF
ncbi:MAG: hypothetical protein QOJ29_4067, partial [Thermoleophilaceae bacterium]|nr:hypothetical protein [Thermoleophilaceae bacterium]